MLKLPQQVYFHLLWRIVDLRYSQLCMIPHCVYDTPLSVLAFDVRRIWGDNFGFISPRIMTQNTKINIYLKQQQNTHIRSILYVSVYAIQLLSLEGGRNIIIFTTCEAR